MEAKIKLDHSETTFNRFLMQKLVYRMKIRSICNIFDFRTLFHQGTDDQEQIKAYRMIFDQFGTFSIFGLFFIKGADDQERQVKSF